MNRPLILIVLNIIILPSELICQETDYNTGYQMIIMNNPAFAGGEGSGKLRISYLDFYPGNNYNLHSFYASYDEYFPIMHGGAGFYISDDYRGGIVNDLRGGMSYSYFLQAGTDLFLNAGLTAGFFHRGLSFRDAILPDQIDPLGGITGISGETLTDMGHTVFDIGAGFLFMSGKFTGGLSANHLSQPDLSDSDLRKETLARKLSINLSGDFNLNRNGSLKVRPLTTISLQHKLLYMGTGAVFESKFLSLNLLLFCNNENTADIQTGFSLNRGKIGFFYNYRFNILSDNKMKPFSILHHTGLAFSLNNVDKRKNIKTINFPKL
jgi:type IX secretion system PorP/SprF family membrane protein